MRKQHAQDAGYIAERTNPFVAGRKVVIYRAAEQGIDVGSKYAVVCDAHGVVCGQTSVRKSRVLMKRPDHFCGECYTAYYEAAD